MGLARSHGRVHECGIKAALPISTLFPPGPSVLGGQAEAFLPDWNFFTACWLLFFLVWGFAAFRVKPIQEKQDRKARLATFAFYTIMLTLLANRISWLGLRTCLWPTAGTVLLVARVLVVAGLATMVWARLCLGANWSATVTFRQGHELVRHGPYRFVRHPIYTGMLLMVAGTAVALGNPAGLLATAICLIGNWWKLKREEALLLKHFPDTYPDYVARTKALIPFVF